MKMFRFSQKIKNINKRLIYLAFTIVFMVSMSLPAYASPAFTNHSLSSGFTDPGSVTTADGSLWYIQRVSGNSSHIGKMTTSGTITNYDIPTLSGVSGLHVHSLVTGSDGNIWFNAKTSTVIYIGVLNTSTGTATTYWGGTYTNKLPSRLVVGSDGNLWHYTQRTNNTKKELVRFNPSTQVATVIYTSDTYAVWNSIAADPDGDIWIADNYYDRVLNFGTDGISGGTYLISGATYLTGLTAGPDGNIWFSDSWTTIKKLTPGAGVTGSYAVPSGTQAGFLAAGPDGAVWYIDIASPSKIGRITSTGNITDYTIPGTSVNNVTGLTVGPDGAMWFGYGDSAGWKLGRLGY